MAAATCQNIRNSLQHLCVDEPRLWLVGFSGAKDSSLVAALVFDGVMFIPPEQRSNPATWHLAAWSAVGTRTSVGRCCRINPACQRVAKVPGFQNGPPNRLDIALRVAASWHGAMADRDVEIQFLLTLPPRMAEHFEAITGRRRPGWFACSDSSGPPLGSGGGTANLLVEAWRATGNGADFCAWLHAGRKLILHSGGQSRRLPAYAPTGKLLLPVPVLRWARGQRLDQTLVDLQLPEYTRVLSHAGPRVVAMLVSGDTLVRVGHDLPPFPDVDVLGLGLWGTPEKAKDFGVFFTPRGDAYNLSFFLQKPSPARIRELAENQLYLIDSGIWLLSERAVKALLTRCGWEEATGKFAGERAAHYDFYSGFAPALGQTPARPDPLVSLLTCAVVPLPEAGFHHFGTNTQLIHSVSELQNLVLDEAKVGVPGSRRHPDQYLQNTRFEVPQRREENHTLWVENSVIPASWRLACEHVLTGVPDNQWELALAPGVCLDFVPMGDAQTAIRAYGFRDEFRGALGAPNAVWFGRPAGDWFRARGLELTDCGLRPEEDLQECALFPVMPAAEVDPRFLEWFFAARPERRPDFTEKWRSARRLSAQQLCESANVVRLLEQRRRLQDEALLPLLRHFRRSVFFRLDLESTARDFARTPHPVPPLEFTGDEDPLAPVHDQMFRAAVERHRGRTDAARHEEAAFAHLRRLIVREAQISPALPRRSVIDDQIVWARSPVRLDLAGGWTDTPPYCIEFGGKVLNVAADLNGQPPVQVFAKLCERPELVVRSIDLGAEERIRTYAELEGFTQPGSSFALAKAALALAGFLPRFHADGSFPSLEAQLRAFGGGLELSLLAAAPKGSGLGTSSILAATVLAALSELCGLEWDRQVLFSRTLALEQLLTTGGGWQDQAGGLYRGIKLIETAPGLAQKPTLRWLPEHLLGHDFANRRVLLYYTGVTRLAKNILAEIVRGIFLNSPSHLELIADIGRSADVAGAAIQQCDYELLAVAIRDYWRLTQRLDRGTNPPPIQAILSAVEDYLSAAKLLGAGGGGYLLMLAKDDEAAARIRQRLTRHPPNERARFVNFNVSHTGLQVTRS